MNPLPDKIWESEQNQERNAGRAPTRPQNAPLGRKKHTHKKRQEEEDGGMLVLNAEAGQQSENEPRARTGAAICDAQQHKHRSHPETWFEGIHGKEI